MLSPHARRRLLSGAVSVLLLAGTACSSGTADDASATPAGCRLLPESQVAALVGQDSRSSGRGTVQRLREQRARATCRTVAAHDPHRSVTLEAVYHPKPFHLPDDECNEGWVYAGTPEKNTPACQEYAHGRGRTELIVRWQPYVMTVTVDRPDRQWAGDAEAALKMSRDLAQRLGVREAAGDG
jgi:hypothetical protein